LNSHKHAERSKEVTLFPSNKSIFKSTDVHMLLLSVVILLLSISDSFPLSMTDPGDNKDELILSSPIEASPAWSYEGLNNSFGWSVSTAGDVNGDGYSDIVVSCHMYNSSIYMFLGFAGGVLETPDGIITDGVAYDSYGTSVSCAGDVDGDGYDDVIVGAPQSNNGIDKQGRAYLYRGSSSGLLPDYVWSFPGRQTEARLGFCVSTAGDVNGDGYADILIGAPGYDNGEYNEGRAMLFLGSASGLSGPPDWWMESNIAGAFFGSSLATAGDVNGDGYSDVIIGARFYSNGQTEQGAAFVYLGSPSGLMDNPAWFVEGDDQGNRFGASVATAGDINGDGFSDVIISETHYSESDFTPDGRVFVFNGSPTGLEDTASWRATYEPDYQYGYSVAPAGDVNGDGFSDVIIGSYAGKWDDQGIVHVYTGSPSGLSSTPSWRGGGEPSTPKSFGNSVCTAGDVNGDGVSDIIIGDSYYKSGDGRAVVYLGSQRLTSLKPQWDWKIDGHQDNGWFGHSVANAGDVNGDGYPDVVVGEFLNDGTYEDAGAVHVYLSGESGLEALPAWTMTGSRYGEWFGYSVSSAGDVNGDGLGDIIVGAPNYSNGEAGEGGAFLYLGSMSGLPAKCSWAGESNEVGAAFGVSVAGVGDVNIDGYGDVVVGAFRHYAGAPEAGCAYLYLGSSMGLSPHPAWTAEGEDGFAWFGYAVSGAGDVNRDGFSDVIVGAPSNGGGLEGRAYLFMGTVAGLDKQARWIGRQEGVERFGSRVSSAGDVNNDRYWDILIAANNDLLVGGAAERIFLYHGASYGPEEEPQWTFTVNRLFDLFHGSVAAAGDINGDGYGDVIIGDYLYDSQQTESGRALVFHGSQQGLAEQPSWTIASDDSFSRFAYSVAAAGDLNDDGGDDILIGAPRYGGANRGAVFAFGSDGHRHECISRQMRVHDSGPIAPMGLSYSENGFRLCAITRKVPFYGKIALEWEVKEHDVPLNGTDIHKSPFVNYHDLPQDQHNNYVIKALVTGLSDGQLYHWRLRMATASPYYPHGPWITLPTNPASLGDIRIGLPLLVGTDLPIVVDTTESDTEKTPVFSLNSIHPNPFRQETTIRYTLPATTDVSLVIYDVRGRRVRTLVRTEKNAGSHTQLWDGTNDKRIKVGSGIYFVRLDADDLRQARKIIRIK
jgi:hypothetical protein